LSRLTRFLDGYPQWVRLTLSGIVTAVLFGALSLALGQSLTGALSGAVVFAVLSNILMALYRGWRPWHQGPER
jgi:hypothetical protein